MMDKRHSKRLSGKKLGILMMLVISMVFVGVYCLMDRDAVRVRADGQIGDLQFYKGGAPVDNGLPLEYTSETTKIYIKGSIPSDAEYEWEVIDPEIIQIKGSKEKEFVELTINSPGYSGLKVTVKPQNGTPTLIKY